MTYMQRKIRRRARGPLSDWPSSDPVNDGWPFQDDTISSCLQQANTATAPFDSKIEQMARDWNPTGFYETADIRKLISAVMGNVAAAQQALDAAASEPTASASRDSIMRATNDLARVGERSLPYLEAAREADEKGLRVVNAPGLKRWVTDSLGTSSSSMVTATVVGCIKPWWVSALGLFQSTFDAVWSVVQTVAGTVLAIGEVALKVATMPSFFTIAAVAIGAYVVWDFGSAFIDKSRGRSGRSLRQFATSITGGRNR